MSLAIIKALMMICFYFCLFFSCCPSPYPNRSAIYQTNDLLDCHLSTGKNSLFKNQKLESNIIYFLSLGFAFLLCSLSVLHIHT